MAFLASAKTCFYNLQIVIVAPKIDPNPQAMSCAALNPSPTMQKAVRSTATLLHAIRRRRGLAKIDPCWAFAAMVT